MSSKRPARTKSYYDADRDVYHLSSTVENSESNQISASVLNSILVNSAKGIETGKITLASLSSGAYYGESFGNPTVRSTDIHAGYISQNLDLAKYSIQDVMVLSMNKLGDTFAINFESHRYPREW